MASPAPDRVYVMFACNAPESGAFTGRVDQIEIGDADLKLVCASARGWRMREDGDTVRVARERFATRGDWGHWVGNWCWDGVTMPIAEARRLAEHLLAGGWDLEEAVTEGGPFADIACRAFGEGTC